MEIVRRLEVIGQDRILIPGCEPVSEVTSPTLMRELRKGGLCTNSYAYLQEALDAIPGSYVEFGVNYGYGPIKKFFVLPPATIRCCDSGLDWFSILKSLPGNPQATEEEHEECASFSFSQCPSGSLVTSPVSTYVPEGTDILGINPNP